VAPVALERFADRDLLSIAPCALVNLDSADAVFAAAAAFPPSPWLYTGPLENRPELVGRLAAIRPLWGVDEAGLRLVRHPLFLGHALERAGLPFLPVRQSDDGLPRDGSWLRKRRNSAGGYGVEPLLSPARLGRFFYQRRADGLSLSALFVADRMGRCSWLGLTRQLLGRPGFPYAFRGSVGPWPVPDEVAGRIAATGAALAAASSGRLIGIFGVDLILSPDGVVWPVEVNPRYTASVEVLELAGKVSLLDAHLRACEGKSVATSPVRHADRCVAKAFVFAESDASFDGVAFNPPDAADPYQVLPFGDVPEPGTWIAAGSPMMTVFAVGETVDEARLRVESAQECLGLSGRAGAEKR
jgi:predicted ATP-grasp superfamily ATP-dependent carboligase